MVKLSNPDDSDICDPPSLFPFRWAAETQSSDLPYNRVLARAHEQDNLIPNISTIGLSFDSTISYKGV
jgi:hypothetical protein